MNNTPKLSFWLDTRREKKTGKYPVKICVFRNKPRKRKYYSIGYDYSLEEFNQVWKADYSSKAGKRATRAIKEEHKKERKELEIILEKALEIAKSMEIFDFGTFEKELKIKDGESNTLQYQYNLIIKQKQKAGRVSTASSYIDSLRSIEAFILYKNGSNAEVYNEPIYFSQIDSNFLKDYEHFMLDYLERSKATIGIYLRSLRSVFNSAIENRVIEKDYYPFGTESSGKYSIPISIKTKKPLSDFELSLLKNYEPKSANERLSLDFWFFSYCCNGMNMKDILSIKNKDLNKNGFSFIRAKTKYTRKKEKKIEVMFNSLSLEILERQRGADLSPNSYVFPILQGERSPKKVSDKIKNFTKLVNKNMRQIAANCNIEGDVSTYVARHTYVRKVMANGGNLELIQENLGHENISTTQAYWHGFPKEIQSEMAKSILNF